MNMERSSISAMIIHVNLQDICEIRLHSKTRLVILNVSANSVDRKYLRMTEHHCLLQFKEFELYWGAVFFLRSVHTFS